MKLIEKNIFRIISTLIIFVIVFSNFVPTIANSIPTEQVTSEANVEFNATIKNEYSAKADIEEDVKLNITVKVSNTGYLKDGIIALEGNNYAIAQTSNENAKAINGNSIELNTVNAGEILNVELPIKINKQDYVSADEFNKDSAITLNATYVNEKGKEKKVSKTLTEHLEWTADVKENIEQTLVRNIKYDDNKTMLSYEIKEGIEENKLPVTNKTISIVVPEINKTKPSKVIVTGDGINYDYKDGILTINKTNTANSEGKIKWNSADTYMVTYMYDAAATEEKITTSAKASVTTIKGDIVEGQTAVNEYDVKAEVGSIVETSIEGTNEINKGYMYTNINRVENKLDTEYTVVYKTNIGYADLTDKIIITEQSNKFTDENGKEILDATDNIISKKVTISADELTKILGTDGTIAVKDTNGTTLGTLNKDTVELNVNTNKLVFETSKPQTEGNLTITVNKVISGNANYTKLQIQSFKKSSIEIKSVNIYKENEISNKIIKKSITLNDPISKATIDINNTTLSTIKKNENTIITAVLKTNDITDALYSNPELKITLPEEVTNVELQSAKLLYEDEMVPGEFRTNGREILLKLDGKQTKYAENSITGGAVVRILANLTLDNLSTSKNSKIILDYANEETAEISKVSEDIKIVAPEGFITTNSIEIGNKKITSQETTENMIQVPANSETVKATISGTVVNNNGKDVKEFKILGRIPFKNNTTTDSKSASLGSTFDTIIKSSIDVSGVDSTIYYSENKEATIDLGRSDNLWTTKFNDNVKTYMIIANNIIPNNAIINYNYQINIPKNIDYDNNTKATYSIYYNKLQENNDLQDIISVANVGIKTEDTPVIKTTIKALDYQTDESYNGQIPGGKYVKYVTTIFNTGNETAKNVSAKIYRPKEASFKLTEYDELTGFNEIRMDSSIDYITSKVGDIRAGESKSIDTIVKMPFYTDIDKTVELKVEIIADNIVEGSSSIYESKIVDSTLFTEIISTADGKSLDNDSEYDYILNIENYTKSDINDLNTSIKIPDGMEIISMDDTVSYNEKTKEITYMQNNVAKGSRKSLKFRLKTNENNQISKQVVIIATTTYSGQEKNIKSNKITSTIGDINGISATLSHNIDGALLDTDQLQYYITVNNNSKKNMEIYIADAIPKQLQIKKYIIKNGDNAQEYDSTTNSISLQETLKSGKILKVIITTTPYLLDEKNSAKEIENKVYITADNKEIEVNSITNTINGTRNKTQTIEQGAEHNFDNKEENTFKISGMAWIDLNNDGKRDTSEESLSNVTFKLVNKKNGAIIKDTSGKDLTSKSDENGNYLFEKIKQGEYIVMSEFDNNYYEVTKYQVDNLSKEETSEFIQNYENSSFAITNTIKIENSNVYNINIGLKEKKKFDLKLDQNVTKIVVANSTQETIVNTCNTHLAKIELSPDTIDEDIVLIEYTISITNVGNIGGYAKQIVDYIPNSMNFNSEINPNWYIKGKNIYTDELSNTEIQPNQTKSIKIILSKKMTGENIGIIHNIIEISKDYNEYGIIDSNSLVANKKDDENDMDYADVLIAINTGKEIIKTIIKILVLSSVVIISISIIIIKKEKK